TPTARPPSRRAPPRAPRSPRPRASDPRRRATRAAAPTAGVREPPPARAWRRGRRGAAPAGGGPESRTGSFPLPLLFSVGRGEQPVLAVLLLLVDPVRHHQVLSQLGEAPL